MHREFEGIDILVNNAGITRDRSFRKMDRDTWDEVINTNLNSVFDITRAFIDPMAARGWGRVINVSSIIGRIGHFGQANYSAAKAGLIGLTKTLAREYASKASHGERRRPRLRQDAHDGGGSRHGAASPCST